MRKNLLLAVLIFSALSSSMMAQLSVGFKTSPFALNTSKMVGTYETTKNLDGSIRTADDFDAYSPLINMGFTAKYQFENSVTLATEFTYKMQGFQDEDESDIFKLDYIEIPLLAGYSFGDKTKLFVQAGPSVKFLTRAEYEFINSDGETDDNDLKSALVLFKPTVLVANAGIGISRQISDLISINAEYRFGYDLTNVTGDTYDDDSDYEGEKTISGNEWNFESTHLVQSALTIGVTFTFRDYSTQAALPSER